MILLNFRISSVTPGVANQSASQELAAMKASLFKALRNFPEARAAIVAAAQEEMERARKRQPQHLYR